MIAKRVLLPMLGLPPWRMILRALDGLGNTSWVAIAIAGALATTLLFTGVFAFEIPRPEELPADPAMARSTLILDRNGKQIAALHGEEHRVTIPLDQMPEHLRQAVLAIEDHAFYQHNGISMIAIARALASNVAAGRVREGGSTITQQYVRNAFDEIGRERTLGRKIEEVGAALELEERLSKDQILELYLNTVYFGKGAYGVEAAAQTYFSKPARHLRLVEAAFLAGVIHAPGIYTDDARAARLRRNVVLDRMADLSYLPRARAHAATRRPLGFDPRKDVPVRAAYFVEYVRRLLKQPPDVGGFGLSDEQILTGGLTVHTTLDLKMQRAAEQAIKTILYDKDDPEAALVAMSTDGEIRAMVGGRTFTSISRARGFNFATQRVAGGGRQPGSAFKPFTLAAYLEQDKDPREVYRAPSRITVDECKNADGSSWRPQNYKGEGYGSMDVIEATEKSVNTVYAQMVAEVGPSEVVAMARRAGIESPLEPVCSIALGAFGVTPLEMARAYATFAAGGMRPEITAVTRVDGPDGRVIAQRSAAASPTVRPEVAQEVSAILERVIEEGTGTPARISRPAAGKTGTNEEHRDVWFAGYTPHPGLVAAVWMGRPPRKDGTIEPMVNLHGLEVTGGGFPGRMWALFMEKALAETRLFSFEEVEWRPRKDEEPDVRSSETVVPAPSPTPTKRRGKDPSGEPSPSPTPTASPSPSPSPAPTEDGEGGG